MIISPVIDCFWAILTSAPSSSFYLSISAVEWRTLLSIIQFLPGTVIWQLFKSLITWQNKLPTLILISWEYFYPELSTLSLPDPPLPVKNFSCISENWSNLNCTWEEQFNPVRTRYTLHYAEPGSRYQSVSFTQPWVKPLQVLEQVVPEN